MPVVMSRKVALNGFAVGAAAGVGREVIGPTPDHDFVRLLRRRDELERISSHVIDAERAARRRIRADGVRPEGRIDAPIGLIEVRFVRPQLVPMREQPIVGAARRPLPFDLRAETRARHALGRAQPFEEAHRVGRLDADDRKSRPVLTRSIVATDVAERLAKLCAVTMAGRLGHQLPLPIDALAARLLETHRSPAAAGGCVGRISHALGRRQCVEKRNPLGVGRFMARDAVALGVPPVDRNRAEELRSHLLVRVAEPELARRHVHESLGHRGDRRQDQLDGDLFPAAHLERVDDLGQPGARGHQAIGSRRQRRRPRRRSFRDRLRQSDGPSAGRVRNVPARSREAAGVVRSTSVPGVFKRLRRPPSRHRRRCVPATPPPCCRNENLPQTGNVRSARRRGGRGAAAAIDRA